MEQAGCDEWCAGMPLVEVRPFTPQEREELRRELARARRRGRAAFLTGCGLPVLSAFLASGAPNHSPLQSAAMIGFFLSLAVGLPAFGLFARDAFRRGRAARADLREGFVKRYEGAFAPPDVNQDDSLLQLRKLAERHAAGAESVGMETLSASGRVWRVQGQPVPGWIVARPVSVAAPPEFAGLAAQWLEPVAVNEEGARLLGGQRELSPAEREEIIRYARTVWRRFVPGAIGFTLWFGAYAAFAYWNDATGARRWILPALLGVSAFACDFLLVMTLRLSRALRKDAEAGRLLIFRPETGADAGQEPPTVEVLPVAGQEWTRGGRPAPWRSAR